MKYGSKDVVSGRIGTKVLQSVYYGAKVVWMAVQSLFFTKDEEYVETADGMIFDCKEDK